MGGDRTQEQIAVAAPAQACFDALLDYESMPEWQSTVRRCTVLSRDDAGRGLDVEWEIDAKLRTVHYTLRYEYDEPHRIDCAYVDGDVKSIDGEYVLAEDGDGRTLVTFRLEIDPGMWVPGKVKRMLNEQVMRRSIEDLKRRVEGG